MRLSWPSISPLALLPLLAACDERVGDDYRGQSLLHLEGRVVISDLDAPGDLTPALAFAGPDGVELVDVDVRGDFPNGFSLDIYAPPPARAIWSAENDALIPEGQELAIAHIAALPRGHSGRMVLAKEVYAEPLDALPACATTPGCAYVERWCLDEHKQDCRLVGLPECDQGDCAPVLSEGNPSIQLNDDTPGQYAGLSEQHILLWTRNGLPASSSFLHFLGVNQALKPGYTLVELGTPRPRGRADGSEPTRDDCVGEECGELFEEEALALYNQRHGTDYRSTDDVSYEALGEQAADDILREIRDLQLQAAVAAGRDVAEFEGTKVITDQHTNLRIRISPDVEPIL